MSDDHGLPGPEYPPASRYDDPSQVTADHDYPDDHCEASKRPTIVSLRYHVTVADPRGGDEDAPCGLCVALILALEA